MPKFMTVCLILIVSPVIYFYSVFSELEFEVIIAENIFYIACCRVED